MQREGFIKLSYQAHVTNKPIRSTRADVAEREVNHVICEIPKIPRRWKGEACSRKDSSLSQSGREEKH